MYYYGYKLHGVTSLNGVFYSFDLTKASIHDIDMIQDFKQQLSQCVILGDKGYLGRQLQLDLFDHQSIELNTPLRRQNQKEYKPYYYPFKKARKRIETLFSQLCDQFMIRRNYAKSFEGFRTRILSKITAMTLMPVPQLF